VALALAVALAFWVCSASVAGGARESAKLVTPLHVAT
jgi:hypothetical protein